MDIVCDTNVWYEIGYGQTDPDELKADGNRLLATPLSLLELSSKMDETNFDARRDAAKAMLDHADEILLDPEHHLAAIWRVTPQYAPFDWELGIRTLARARSLTELDRGVIDPEHQIQMKVNVSYATEWRVNRYSEFVAAMLKVVDRFWPGYEAARLNKKSIHMPREFGEEFDRATSYPLQIRQYVLATYARATQLPENEEIPIPPEEVVEEAVRQLTPYARVYQKYVVRLATINTPNPNDLGDLECFLYAQDGRRVFTFDKNWIQIALDADCGDYILSMS